MRILYGISTALCVAFTMGGALPAGAADRTPIVKAPAAVAVVTCSNLSWTHGWLDHGGWGGWGYYDGLVINDWPGQCSTLVGAGPYAMAPRDAAPAPARRSKR